MLGCAVIITVYHFTVFVWSVKLAWSVFYRSSVLPELDKIHTIKELLYVKFGVVYMYLPLSVLTQDDFILEPLCTRYSAFYLCYFLFEVFLYDFIINK